ncbi:uncharacterized protein ACLA_019800 [Aspergillus clavatus NRRL 1]|uniref:Uncharacterized protein n=1 Tax=Aspergillus clavatus (strain ATCC 1007 / CBS 513.65 / DSM 816 / NCTC 3887 / NRRL 1 / QM 1276 / 107) TaxID=344612 RepID=A1CNQ4_ASPCL|nr:uncharacterized protein ACLA_019800 [Aspergillus clavatus NRRL 1]EAW07275.1 conserved hypothetical protein [Aspergillus clavatus NRRL 1]
MSYSTGLPRLFPDLPASIRRRMPRLYSSLQGTAELAAARRTTNDESASGSFPDSGPGYYRSALASEMGSEDSQRPATAGSSVGPESCDSSFSAKTSEIFSLDDGRDSDTTERSPVVSTYEVESGLRWNRVTPGVSAALNLLRNAGYEAQQPNCDGRLIRSLYINAVSYLLDALPSDLTYEETATIQHSLPVSIKATLATPASAQSAGTPAPLAHSRGGSRQLPERSYLHRLLASSIVQFFLLVQFLMPYVKILLQQVYQYERSHRLTERVVAATLDAADSFGKGSLSLGSTVLSLNDGRFGTAVTDLAAWWVEGVAGGIYEGVGEGMMILGLIRPQSDLQRIPVQMQAR